MNHTMDAISSIKEILAKPLPMTVSLDYYAQVVDEVRNIIIRHCVLSQLSNMQIDPQLMEADNLYSNDNLSNPFGLDWSILQHNFGCHFLFRGYKEQRLPYTAFCAIAILLNKNAQTIATPEINIATTQMWEHEQQIVHHQYFTTHDEIVRHGFRIIDQDGSIEGRYEEIVVLDRYNQTALAFGTTLFYRESSHCEVCNISYRHYRFSGFELTFKETSRNALQWNGAIKAFGNYLAKLENGKPNRIEQRSQLITALSTYFPLPIDIINTHILAYVNLPPIPSDSYLPPSIAPTPSSDSSTTSSSSASSSKCIVQ